MADRSLFFVDFKETPCICLHNFSGIRVQMKHSSDISAFTFVVLALLEKNFQDAHLARVAFAICM